MSVKISRGGILILFPDDQKGEALDAHSSQFPQGRGRCDGRGGRRPHDPGARCPGSRTAENLTVEPLRPRLRQVVRSVGQGVGQQARSGRHRGPRRVRRRRSARDRGSRRPVRSRHQHVPRAGQRLRGARDRPRRRRDEPREEIRQAGGAGASLDLQPVHQEAVRALRHVGARSRQLPQGSVDEDRDAERTGHLRRPREGGAGDQEGRPQMQNPIRVGLSQDIDSNMAVRNILWCHGGSIQDKDGNVVLNSPETLRALEYTKKLYSVGMTQAVLSWNAASNNQAFNAQETAYILNSISAYRTAQDNKLPVLENYFFTPALKGPTGIQLASEHVMSGYVVWKFSKNQDVAKEFLVALVDASRDSMLGSKLYNFPSFYGAAADPGTPPPKKQESGAVWIAAQCNKDPFGSAPADKLALLAKSLPWSTNLGYPGYANPAEGEMFDTYVITDMFAKAATGAMAPKDAMLEANTRARQIFDKWRAKKMVGGGGKDK